MSEINRKPKLLILSGLYPNTDNPVRGTFVQAQAQALAADYDIRVLAWEFPGKAACQHSQEPGVEVTYLRFPAIKGFFPSSIPAFSRFVLPQIKQVYAQWQPDLIHVHDFAHLPGLYILRGWLSRINIPSFLTLHNLKSLPGVLNHPATNRIYAKTLHKALHGWTRIFTVNPRLAELAGRYGSPAQCIGNGVAEAPRVDSPALQNIRAWLPAQGVKILSVGNLITSKGFDLLIQSINELEDMGIPVRTLIIGEGSERSKLESLVGKLGLEGKVWLPGALSNAEVRSLYSEFDIFALPSYSETFGIVYLEASWAGIPSIGVREQGVWGLLEENSEALFMEPGDRKGLTALLRRLAENPEERKELGARARERCLRDYRLDKVLDKIIQHYREALS